MATTMQFHEMSKTYQYRKVMKPMLERKRRARINKCLDELKDLMVSTLESEGEHVTRLEKADILELTVQHLQKLKQKKRGLENIQTNSVFNQIEGFRSGFLYAANEISRNLANLPDINNKFGTKLMSHLDQHLNQLNKTTISRTQPASIPLNTPISINCEHQPLALSTARLTSPTKSIHSPILEGSSVHRFGLYNSHSIPLSPLSNYSQSPKHNTMYDSPQNGHYGFNLVQGTDENVWRPWF